MKRFWQILKEDAPISGGGMPPPPPGGGMGGMGGGMPPMPPPGGGMGLGGPPMGGGLGGPPMGGGAPTSPVQTPEQLVPLTVWQVLTKILEGKPIKNQSGQGKGDVIKSPQLPQPSPPSPDPSGLNSQIPAP